jgi:hypothetical protein
MQKAVKPLSTIVEVKPHTFIYEKRHALPADACEEMIRRFEAHTDEQYLGRIGQQAQEDASIKKSTDLVVSGKEHWKDMGYAIQRTLPGEHYHWHIDGGSHEFSQRQLVAVWYLNDVAGPGGETEFLFQDVKIKPEQGKLILFPPFWTHEHRGVTLQQGVKYIATTWVVFA